MEKTYIIFGGVHHQNVLEAAKKAVEDRFSKNGQKARYFDPKVDIKPDACLYISKGLFPTKEGFTRYYITTLKGKAVVDISA
jgi:hypothetical protein